MASLPRSPVRTRTGISIAHNSVGPGSARARTFATRAASVGTGAPRAAAAPAKRGTAAARAGSNSAKGTKAPARQAVVKAARGGTPAKKKR